MPAPEFRLPGSDGEPHTLGELTAEAPALLIFFRSGCPTCRLWAMGDATGRSVAPVSTEADGLPVFKPG